MTKFKVCVPYLAWVTVEADNVDDARDKCNDVEFDVMCNNPDVSIIATSQYDDREVYSSAELGIEV